MKSIASLLLATLISLAPAIATAQSDAQATAQSTQSVVRLDHVALRVIDLDRSIEFYNEAFNFKVKTRWDTMTLGSGERSMTIDMAGVMLEDDAGGIIEMFGDGVESERQAYQQPINHFGLVVTEIEAVYNTALEAGATAVTPPTPVSARGMTGTIAFVLGPDSERIELIQYD
ncbi:hypothetical protein BCU68_12255 [Vibrio sp. 10N.286.49.B3]|uniref:VOC family protein n=1 Tax=Vibrio sp. 10N.286.49.B3 TaxID=1880855 RepID=UPI000C836A1D|nr:VOC family protein [Vibrio sp. 10N.286.49.B3]PMH44619.1 hypothetical protein BCU68_12255 [Vibrio sp. 10N.286.49.B3]